MDGIQVRNRALLATVRRSKAERDCATANMQLPFPLRHAVLPTSKLRTRHHLLSEEGTNLLKSSC
jgi:hypothetical protein